MRLDAHQHFWRYNKEKHSWITDEMKVIRRDFPPGDLFPILKEAKLDGTIAVQADESFRETEYLLELADENEWIKGVVGWTSLGDDKLEEVLDRLSSRKKLKGFREVLQSRDPDYMNQKDFIKGLHKIGKRGYTYDILIFPEHLDASLKLIKACPEQLFVIDHLAKPKIKAGNWKDWKKKMGLLAERELVYCKLSGMVTEADLKSWKSADILPFMEIALELFGPTKLMYGSDWPVCLVAAEYEEVFSLVDRFTDSLSSDEKAAIMGETAKDFYGINL
jgi:L-fuconolactonase